MFPQFYFLSSISASNPLYEQKLSQIRKHLSSINKIVNVIVVGGSKDSIALGEELFGSQSTKKKMFLQGMMRDRVDDQNASVLKLRQQQVEKLSKVYCNLEQFLRQEQKQQPPAIQKSLAQFIHRIKQLKCQLIHYTHHPQQQHSKIILIASSELLNLLGATDYHQNGQPVNGLHLNEGDIDLVNLVVDWDESMRELTKSQGLFCS